MKQSDMKQSNMKRTDMKRTNAAVLLLVLYGLSGVTALAYEVLWTRMLSLLFGISILGVVVTVAAFMLGLGLGSFMGCRWQGTVKNTLRLLAAIEISVALYAVFLPTLMPWLQGLWLSVDDLAVWQFWQIASALWVLCLPAMALGFAFPAMLRVGKSLQLSLGSLYGINTMGGALGALLPLMLLPLVGWVLAIQSVAGLGVLLGLALLYLSWRLAAADSTESPSSPNSGRVTDYASLLVYAGMGAGALMLEIAWTRAYGMILLRTEYVLAVILAVFLVGIGAGSAIATYLPRSRALQFMPVLVALMAVAGLYAFPQINAWGQSMSFDSLSMTLLFQGLLIALCTLPVTLALGAWLPLIATRDEGAWLYAANSVGACLGALVAGFVFIPWLGTAATWLLAAALIMLCGCYWQSEAKRLPSAAVSLALFIVLAWPVYHLPPAALLLQAELPASTDLYQHEDAISITHVVQRQDGQRILLADLQRMDASSDPTSVAVQKNQARLPMFLHGKAENVLFLGLGTGITASGALAWPDAQLHAVELSRGAVVAAQDYFDRVNDGVMATLDLQHDEARRFLMRSEQHYDVIVGDLFHPDMVGRGALLSVEQFRRAKKRLNEQGLFVQWLAFNQFDQHSLQVVLRSFADVFAHNAVFVDGYRLGLVGFANQHRPASVLLTAAPAKGLWGDEGGWTWIGRYWGDVSSLLGDAMQGSRQGEWTPVIEFSLPSMRYAENTLPELLQWLIERRIALAEAERYWSIDASQVMSFKRSWASSELNTRAQLLSLQGKAGAERLQALAYRANPDNRWAAFALADAMFASLEGGLPPGLSYEQALQKILVIRPDHEAALKAMLALFEERGDVNAMKSYRDRLFHISPYARVSL